MKKRLNTIDLCYIAMGAILICITAWISIPAVIPFTLQTFGVFVVLQVLGGRRGLMSVLLYILLGVVGLPVFSGFMGGPGVFYSATGGFIVGFIPLALLYRIITGVFNKKHVTTPALISGLIVCYVTGTFWYAHITGGISMFFNALYVCVLPFIIPDICKLIASKLVADRVRKYIKNI